MEVLHLFYVESNFHLILAENFINDIGIEVSDVLFVTHRGVQLPSIYRDRLLYDGTLSQFRQRVQLYRENRNYYKGLLKRKKVISYSPFQFLFPAIRFFSEYHLIEEGFSAYGVLSDIDNSRALRYELFKALYINLAFPFVSRNIKGFLMGISFSSKKTTRPTKLLVSNVNAYDNYCWGKWVEKQIVPIRGVMKGSIIGQNILVMDRLSKKGRPFDDNVYLCVLKDVINTLGLDKQVLLVKLHPADLASENNVKSRLSSWFHDIGIMPNYINDNLEELALSNNNNTFIGTNSTSLYYAPIFGRTNKAISFARLLANEDKQYALFLERWGGTETFCDLFSKEVKCL